ncbi:hypothetical protein [Halomicrobium mukohataei]|uniref:hypothetical protein n=1 Tax=Halomicrobium mukohataei TaxID=57705 RepID=UPI001474B0D5|nr:hypothetical protein [Halomicrobium mukohataei]
MSSLFTISTTVVSLLLGGYLYLFLHEYTHWIAGKIFSGDPNTLYDSWGPLPQPYAVEYRNLSQMPNWGIRIAGISPHLIWMFVSLSYAAVAITVPDSTPISIIAEILYSIPPLELVIITGASLAGISVSPSDLVATFQPQRYRMYTGRGFSHSDWADVLFRRRA